MQFLHQNGRRIKRNETILIRNNLRAHQDEFLNRIAFAYTVMSLDESECLGCVYIDPSEKEQFDAEVYLWVRTSELQNGSDELLYEAVKDWIKERWPCEPLPT